jgi:hypothetical protein
MYRRRNKTFNPCSSSPYESSKFDNPWNFIYIVDENGNETFNTAREMQPIVHTIITSTIVSVEYVRPDAITRCNNSIPTGFYLKGKTYKDLTEFNTRAGVLVFMDHSLLKSVKVFSVSADLKQLPHYMAIHH